jgi:hypothetical protein
VVKHVRGSVAAVADLPVVLSDARRLLASLDLDVVIFPDIGM